MENVDRMTEAIRTVVGEQLRPVYELSEEGEGSEPEGERSKEVGEEELIDLIKTNFDAREVPHDNAQEGEAS